MADSCRCAQRTARLAVNELIDGGFLRVERKGRSRGALGARERAVSLTRYNTETQTGDPELPMRTWESLHRDKMTAETPKIQRA